VSENSIIEINQKGISMTAKTNKVPLNWSSIKGGWRRLWQNDEAKFRIFTSLKMTTIPLICFLILGSFIGVLLNLNLIFFKANEFMKIKEFEEVFFHFISQELVDLIPYGGLLFVFVNMTAIYISDILLRPFRMIGDYCEARTNGKESAYNPDFFSDLKLLSSFSEFFFFYIETAEKNKSLQQVVIPKKYTKIHQPVFESTFFLHYFLYIFASLLVVSIAMYTMANGLYGNIISLASQTLPNDQAINAFLNEEKMVIHQIINIVLFTGTILYIGLASHLYYKVSAPAFAIFATMRGFLKGNYSQRVHLIGYPYLRPQMRKLNKYLDVIERELTESDKNKKQASQA
jgi:hypothetical protein